MVTAYSSKATNPVLHAVAAAVPVVFVVDDDDLIRSAVRRLLTNADLATELYASGAEFLAQANIERPGCLILDFKMPGMNGLEVQAALKQRRVELPVIFLTGSSDIPIAVEAMREGAVDFVEKPFDNADLLTRVRQAIERNSKWWRENVDRREILLRFDSLTARERSVFELVVVGKTNKEIARDLGASYRTIEIHRRRVMEKMAAPTLADLVRMRADIDPPASEKNSP
jgi:two-component system response regulator FixJ